MKPAVTIRDVTRSASDEASHAVTTRVREGPRTWTVHGRTRSGVGDHTPDALRSDRRNGSIERLRVAGRCTAAHAGDHDHRAADDEASAERRGAIAFSHAGGSVVVGGATHVVAVTTVLTFPPVAVFAIE